MCLPSYNYLMQQLNTIHQFVYHTLYQKLSQESHHNITKYMYNQNRSKLTS